VTERHCPVRATRLGDGPIISPETPGWTEQGVGKNINGPSLIRRPDWLAGYNSSYLLFFAHHQGRSIRVATADHLLGPWTIDAHGALSIDQTPFTHHIASPDVHVDEHHQRLIMYFHGQRGVTPPARVEQPTLVATSSDGRSWDVHPQVLGESYFRVLHMKDGRYIAVSKGGIIYTADDPLGPFRQTGALDRSGRHWALTRRGDAIHCVYSRWGDQPEHLLYSTIDASDPGDWKLGKRWSLLGPEHEWEGVNEPIRVSRNGAVHRPVHELRDPDCFRDNDGRDYLVYSVAGETGLAIAELHGLPPD